MSELLLTAYSSGHYRHNTPEIEYSRTGAVADASNRPITASAPVMLADAPLFHPTLSLHTAEKSINTALTKAARIINHTMLVVQSR